MREVPEEEAYTALCSYSEPCEGRSQDVLSVGVKVTCCYSVTGCVLRFYVKAFAVHNSELLTGGE